MRDGNKVLQISGLHISFGDQSAVKDVSFLLNAGSVLGIVGESGSGKSLTALSVIGLLPEVKNIHLKGKIEYFNSTGRVIDMASVPVKELNKIRGNEISIIFQDPLSSLNPSMKCGQQAAEPLLRTSKLKKNVAKKRVLDLFAKVKLPDPEKVWQSYPHQLSGGQRQRVMIAMAMSTQPRILIADEPTTALDVTVQKEIIQLIHDLKSEFNTAVIFISHDLALVKTIADDILVMKKGDVVEYNSANKLFSQPKHPYTRALLSCRPGMGENPSRLPTVDDIINNNIREYNPNKQKTELCCTEPAILQVKDLCMFYPVGVRDKNSADAWFRANDHVSFSLFKGETLGLVGESGCGKSTLIRTILQLIKPTSGEVIYNGIDLINASPKTLRKLRTKLQIVFQDPYSSLTPTLTVKEALLEPMMQHRVFSSKAECVEYMAFILEKTGLLADDLNKYPHQFSGGQRQRVVIARALVLKPEIVFCDESVSALDVSVQAQVLNLLNDLKDEFGLTYIFITHDMNVVSYLSDRVMVMYKGKIVEIGKTRDIIEKPTTDYARTLIGSVLEI